MSHAINIKTADLMELLLIYQEKTHLIQFGYFSKSWCLNLEENDLIIFLSNTAVIFLVTKMISNDSIRLKCGKSQTIVRVGNFIFNIIQGCFCYLYILRVYLRLKGISGNFAYIM